MNILKGKIKALNTAGRLTVVTLDVNGILLKSIIIENPETVSYLKLDNPIRVMFKETEVVIGKGQEIPVSMENQIRSTIVEMTKGKLLCSLVLDTEAGKLKATITSESADRLMLRVGETVMALIKTTEIMLSE